MGCGFSKEEKGTGSYYTKSSKRRELTDFDSNAPDTHSNLSQPITIIAPSDPKPQQPPPSYSTGVATPFADQVLRSIKLAFEKGWLDVVPSRYIHLFVDDNPRMDPKIKDAIRVMTCCIILICRAFEANATLYFMSQRNTDDEEMPETMREEAEFLDKAFLTKNWWSVQTFNEENSQFPEFGIQETIAKLEKTPGDSGEKHVKFLSRIREMKLPYWTGWLLASLENKEFIDAFNAALEATRKQPMLLNSQAFTIRNAIQKQTRQQKAGVSQPTTVLILSGSELQESEMKDIAKDMKLVEGGARGFAIQTIALVKAENDRSLSMHRRLDDLMSDDKDIYDVTPVVAKSFIDYGPSGTLWGKIFNSHDPDWDRKKVGHKDFVGATKLFTAQNKPLHHLPMLQDVKLGVGRGPVVSIDREGPVESKDAGGGSADVEESAASQ